METKIEVSSFKGHDVLAIKAASSNFVRISAGYEKWKEVLDNIDAIRHFVAIQEKAREISKVETTSKITQEVTGKPVEQSKKEIQAELFNL